MKTKVAFITALMVTLFAAVVYVGAQPTNVDGSDKDAEENSVEAVNVGVNEQKEAIGEEIYLIRLSDAPVATYVGGVESFQATSPRATGDSKLDMRSPSAIAYRDHLLSTQDALVSSMKQELGRSVEVVYQYYAANNGMAIRMTAAEAQEVSKMNGVIFVQRDFERELQTDNGPAWIGAPGLWDGTNTAGLPGTMGEGIIVGVIDTGINPSNPSFADVGGDGYDHDNPWGASTYVGVCDPADPTYDSTFPCNDKLIGAWGYGDVNGGDPVDYDGHGSHTASTSAGNVVSATVVGYTTSVTRTISGVAPHANIVMYAACCAGSALSAAIDQIVIDGVDVVNYSIGSSSPSNPWTDFDAVGYLAAREAGIFVATSAGNDGPGDETLGSPADVPWLTSVGATTHNRTYPNSLIDMSGSGGTADIEGKGFTAGYGPATIVYAGDLEATYPGAALCGTGPSQDVPDGGSSPFPANTFDGEIVVCDRGTYGRVEKGLNVLLAGAGGFVLANDVDSGNSLSGDNHHLPAVHITYDDGVVLKAWLATGSSHMATITGATLSEDPANGDVMAGFSSRGANRALPDMIGPSISAPGVDILAAYGTGDAIEWGMISGTSMASPHVAGAAALLMALHPEWSPAEVQSAIMMTSWTAVLDDDGVTPATPFDMGNGRIDLNYAAEAGLVMDETIANYENADPALGGDPKTLNIASLGDSGCLGECSWTRTVSNTQAVSVTWTAEVTGSMILTVTPASFEIAPGATQEIVVTADVTGLPLETWEFGKVTLNPSDIGIPSAHFPVAVRYVSGQVPEYVVITTDDISGTHTVQDIISLAADPLNLTADGLVLADATDMSLSQDPTNGDPYDNLNDGSVEYITVTVPSDALRLVAEITESESPDIDLFVGTGTTPSGATQVCSSTTGSWNEYCNITGGDLVAGDWWILVQNWSESANSPDAVKLVSAVVSPGNLGNFTATGPASVAAGAAYDVDLGYDLPGSMPGYVYYGFVTLEDDSTPLANFNVDLYIVETEMLMIDGPAVTFNLGIPNSFVVTDDVGGGLEWTVNGEGTCINDDNWTGGSGLAACADSDAFGTGAYDTSLVSNDVDFSNADSCTTVMLDFVANYRDANNPTQSGDRLDIDVSTDGGTTWTTELTLYDDFGGFGDLPGVAFAVDLIDYLTSDSLHIRFRYYNPDDGASAWDWWAQVDDVSLTCVVAPEINVTPTSLANDVVVDRTGTTRLTIENNGTADLTYNIYEDAAGVRSPNADVLWEQVKTGTGGIVSDYYTDSGFGSYSAEDFVLAGPADLELIYTPGFNNSSDTGATATAVSWYIFADDNGQPSGYPAASGAGAGDAIWYYSGAPTGTGVDITNNEITLDIVAATGSALSLGAGRYWLVVAPSIDVTTNGRWNWSQGVGQELSTHLYDEGNFGGIDWSPLGSIGVTFDALAFRIEGMYTTIETCDVVDDISWLSVSPASGTIAPDAFADSIITYDATGLTTGVYTSTLCINSNDMNNPLVMVPVEMTVVEKLYSYLPAIFKQ